jgi:adenylate cyclase
MANFFAELKRRHIYRVATAYAVAAWLLLQLFNNVELMLKLADWVGTLVLVLLIGGFPVALILAWILELKTPGGVDGVTVEAKSTRVDFVLIGALVIVVALRLYQQLASTPGTEPAQQQAGAVAPSSPAQSGGISVAVLPFVNLSSDKQQEFLIVEGQLRVQPDGAVNVLAPAGRTP